MPVNEEIPGEHKANHGVLLYDWQDRFDTQAASTTSSRPPGQARALAPGKACRTYGQSLEVSDLRSLRYGLWSQLLGDNERNQLDKQVQ